MEYLNNDRIHYILENESSDNIFKDIRRSPNELILEEPNCSLPRAQNKLIGMFENSFWTELFAEE